MTYISLGFAAICFSATLCCGFVTMRLHSRVMEQMDKKLMELLESRLNDNRITSAPQLLGLAANVATAYGVNAPSTKHLVGVIRRLALQIEEANGDLRLIERLEPIRRDLEPKGSPLCSIAVTDRMLALQLMVAVLILVIVCFHFFAVLVITAPGYWLYAVFAIGEAVPVIFAAGLLRYLVAVGRHFGDEHVLW